MNMIKVINCNYYCYDDGDEVVQHVQNENPISSML